MTVVTFEDLLPPARHDDLPWTVARLEEADTATSEDWTEIETWDLDPLDTDPSDPYERRFTTEEATLEAGWYRFIFVDEDGDESEPSEPYQNTETVFGQVRPAVRSLGKLLRARTLDPNGNELGTFTATTRPTSEQANDTLNSATSTVLGQVGDNIATKHFGFTREVIKYFAAFNVELTYWPEQANSDQSAADHYWTMYETLLESLKEALQDNQASNPSPRMYSIPVLGRTGRSVNDNEFFSDDSPWS